MSLPGEVTLVMFFYSSAFEQSEKCCSPYGETSWMIHERKETHVVHVYVLGVTGSSILLIGSNVKLVSSLDRDLSSALTNMQA
jgi:hypothetical protein